MQSNILPLDIQQLSFDIRGLTAVQCGVYLRLVTHYWQYGALPNDLDYAASIAGVCDDAPSILKTCLQRLFHVESDGRLHSRQWGFRFRSEKDKAKKRQAKARHAANSRWERIRERRRNKSEEYMTCLEHGKIENFPPSPAPPLSPPTPLSITPSLSSTREGRIPPLNPPSVAAAPPPAETGTPDLPEGEPPTLESSQQSENKAKPRNFRFRALRRGRGEGNHAAGRENNVAAGAGFRNGHYRERAHRENAPVVEDARFDACRELVFGYWARLNTGHQVCPWGSAERRALRDLLAENPTLPVDHLQRCLANRELSKVNPAALPADWLRRILMYGEKPLNEFDRPLQVKVSPVQAGVYRVPSTPEEIAAYEKSYREGIELLHRDYHSSSAALQKELRETKWWNPEFGRAPWEDEPN